MLDFNIRTLPVDVLHIARAADIKVIKNSSVGVLRKNENGKAYCDGNSWIIIYDDTKPIEISRYTIAHELGHIFLGHSITQTLYTDASEFNHKPRAEKQADMFALRLLCPSCVLWGLDIHRAKDIEALCRIPHKKAVEREKRMKLLYERGKFLTDATEQRLYDSFCQHIADYKNNGGTDVYEKNK